MAKRWDYDEITRIAEDYIRDHMEHVAKDGLSVDSAIHANLACGSYLLWSRITVGWQNEGDDERFQGLIARALTEDRK